MGKAVDQKITVRSYFGGYPKCGRNDGLYNLYKEHWFVCHMVDDFAKITFAKEGVTMEQVFPF
jgi:hypothetical protein